MSSEFPCSQCGRTLQGGGAVGTKILCPNCGAFTPVPDVSAIRPTPAGAPIEFHCTGCDKLLRTPADTAGKQAKCPDCGVVMTVPAAGEGAAEPAGGSPPPPPPPPGVPTGSPFGLTAAQSGEEADAENPYRAPSEYGQAPNQPFGGADVMAANRVAGPATAVIVASGIGLALQGFSLVVNLIMAGVGAAGARGGQNVFPMMFSGGLSILVGGLSIVLGVVIILGALKMKRLESYGFAVAASILVMVPYLSPCCCLGLPFGIWSLVVLNDPAVKAAFRS